MQNKNMFKSKLKIAYLFIMFTILITPCTASTIRDYFVNGQVNELNFLKMRNELSGTLIWIGYGIAVCVIIITGIQFLTATPQKKAQLKEKLWLIVLGIVVLAGCIPIFLTVVNIIADLPW